jgi:hypothetical protein
MQTKWRANLLQRKRVSRPQVLKEGPQNTLKQKRLIDSGQKRHEQRDQEQPPSRYQIHGRGETQIRDGSEGGKQER